MYISVRHLLDLDHFEGLRLISGRDGIDNIVNNTNIMDNPDSFDWLMPGDLVITTGYVFKDDKEYQNKVIKELSENNCAALAIKTRKYFSDMPKEMIDISSQLNLPILEIPPHYSLAQFSNLVNKEILKAQDSLLQKSLEIHEKLTAIPLRGGGLNEIGKEVVKLINNPLIILDLKWHLLTYIEHMDNPFPLRDYLELNIKQRIFPKEFIEGIPNDVVNFKKSIKRKYKTKDIEIVCRIMPITANGEIYGYMVVWETVSKLKKIDYIALEKASIMAALDRIKIKEIEEVKHQNRRDFFDDLLAGKIESIRTVNSLAEMHGLNTNNNYLCMVVRIHLINEKNGNIVAYGRKLKGISETIIDLADDVAQDRKTSVVSIFRGNQVLIFLPFNKTMDNKHAKQNSKEFANKLLLSIGETIPNMDINIGIGKLYDDILKLQLSFIQAQEVIKLGLNLKREHRVLHFDDFQIYHLLEMGTSEKELKDFYENTIADLVRYDKENKTNLVETLEKYFIYQGNISEASKDLYIHRNTFIYRLDKIKNILQTDLKDSEETLELQLGIKAMQILNI